MSYVFSRAHNARVAQLVERDLAKVEAAGSSPVSRLKKKIAHPKGWAIFFVRAPRTELERFEVSPAGSVGAKRSPPESSAPSRAFDDSCQFCASWVSFN